MPPKIVFDPQQIETTRAVVRTEVARLDINNPEPFRLEWDEFSGGNGLFTIRIKAPLKEGSSAQLLQRSLGGQFVSPEEDVEPVLIYQIQLASDGQFASDLTTHDIGIRRNAEIRKANATRYARARARFINGSWSDWFISGSGAVVSNSVSLSNATTSNPSTTSSSFATIPEMTVDHTPKTDRVLILFSGTFDTTGTPGNWSQLSLLPHKDGVSVGSDAVRRHSLQVQATTWHSTRSVSHIWLETGLTPETKVTLDMRWARLLGTETIRAQSIERSFQVEDIS